MPYKRKGTQSWYSEVQWHGKRYGPKSWGPITYQVAVQKELAWKLAIREGRLHERDPVPRFDAFCLEFLRWYAADRQPGSLCKAKTILSRLVGLWGARLLDQVTPVMLEGYKRDRAATVKPRTVNNDLACLRLLFRMADEWGYLERSPMRQVKKLRTTEPRRRVLTPDETKAVLAACDPELRVIVRFALATGLRDRELVTREWRHIDERDGRVIVESETAKGRRLRRVPLSTEAWTALEEAKALSPQERVRIFTLHHIRGRLSTVAKRLGLDQLSPHVLRRTFATRCLEAGIDVIVLRDWLGHRSLVQTQIYTIPSPAHEDVLMRRVERYLSEASSVISSISRQRGE